MVLALSSCAPAAETADVEPVSLSTEPSTNDISIDEPSEGECGCGADYLDGIVIDDQPPRAGDVLLLVTGGMHDVTTLRFRSDGSSVDPIARIDTAVISTAGETWEWNTDQEPVETAACPDGTWLASDDVSYRTRAGFTAGARTVAVADTFTPVDAQDAVGTFRHHVTLIGIVGSWALISESEWGYSCGAHPSEAHAFSVWDLEKGSRVNWMDRVPHVERLRRTAITKLLEDEAFIEMGEAHETELTALRLQFDPERGLSLRYQFTAPTCYACSDGMWSSYTRSVDVDGEPMALPQQAPLPASVRQWLAEHPQIGVRGYSFAR